MNVWNERIEQVLADKNTAKLAAAVYWLVNSHLKTCQHKRQCTEEQLINEAISIVGFASKTAPKE